MSLAGKISIKRIKPEKVEQSQAFNLTFKKNELGTRLAMLEKLGRKIPNINPKPSNSWSPIKMFRAFYPYFSIQVSANDHVQYAIRCLPLPFFRMYFGMFKFLSKI
jgi:hypothetical protein